MKKILISLMLIMPLLSGCANVDTRININDDYSASVITSLTYQGDLSNGADSVAGDISSNYRKFIDPLYSVENAYGAKLSTITAQKSVSDLRKGDLDLSSLGFTSNLPSKRFIEVKKNLLITSFNIDCTYDLSKQIAKYDGLKVSLPANDTETSEDGGVQPEYYHKYGDMSEMEAAPDAEFDMAANMDDATKQLILDDVEEEQVEQQVPKDSEFTTSFSIKVPSFASYNNADSNNGNVYTWNISSDEPTVIKLQYVQYSAPAIACMFLVAILFLVLLVYKIRNHDSQKRIDNIDNIV